MNRDSDYRSKFTNNWRNNSRVLTKPHIFLSYDGSEFAVVGICWDKYLITSADKFRDKLNAERAKS